MSAKDFLLDELYNVDLTLQETLRHDYAPGSGREYFDECKTRIQRLTDETNRVDPGDSTAIAAIASRLSEIVSQPISLIERSHLGEFSWPFAHQLREIATPLCTESGPKGALTPIIHILADGGLGAYRIYTETPLPDPIRHRRILNVVFPRTMKHHVLLHSIFGHEIGHAAWAIPALRSALRTSVIEPLFKESRLETPAEAEKWIQDPARPPEITKYLSDWAIRHTHPFTFLGPNNWAHYSWQQEFFCDLFGVVTFGPSFAGAHKTLLGGIDPSGLMITTSHPPHAARAPLIARAVDSIRCLKFSASGSAQLDAAIAKFKSFVDQMPSTNSNAQIDAAIAGAMTTLAKFPSVLYQALDIQQLRRVCELLARRIPPVGAQLKADGLDLSPLDFRHILACGWIVWLGHDELKLAKPLKFLDVNRLCDRGILHRQAVELERERGGT